MDAPDPIAVSVPPKAGYMAYELVSRLNHAHFRVIDEPGYVREIEVPPDFTAALLAGRATKVRFIRHASGIDADYEVTRVNRVVDSLATDLASLKAQGVPPSDEALVGIRNRLPRIKLNVTSAGKRKVAPIGFEQAVPGMLVMFTMLVLLNAGGVTLLVERRQGILRRLASAPVSRASVVAAKWGARMALAVVQIIFAMITGTVLFKVHWGEHLLAVMLVLISYAAMVAVFGMLLGNFARMEGQVIGVGVILSNVLAALGGCWWPIEIAPPWAQKIALAFPTGWAMDALHKLMSFGDSPAAVLPHVAAFLAVALAGAFVLAKRFRFE
jgi:ABC-type Na+ efflux pump permease subunit